MAKEMEALEISHNDIGEIERGEWRKFNPYNPYVENNNEEKANDLKVESLDDLFEDDEEKSEDIKDKNETKIDFQSIDKLVKDETEKEVSNQTDNEKDEFDLQKRIRS